MKLLSQIFEWDEGIELKCYEGIDNTVGQQVFSIVGEMTALTLTPVTLPFANNLSDCLQEYFQ